MKDLPLTEREEEVLKNRRNLNSNIGRIRAAAALHDLYLERFAVIKKEAEAEFQKYKNEHLFQVGIALYWAEGSKRDTCFGFTNSDPDMLRIMLLWIERFFHVRPEQISMRLYTHRPFSEDNLEYFWSQETGVPLLNFKSTVYKKTGLLVKKRPNYKGCIRMLLGKSIYLKKVLLWQEMLAREYQKS